MLRVVIFCCSAILLLISCKAQKKVAPLLVNDNDNSLLWEVSGNGLKQPSYLFGTFHLMCRNDIQFSAQLQEALARSEQLYLEMDMDDPATMMGGLLLMNMKEGRTLKGLFTEADYERVAAYFKDSLHTPLTFFGNTKPFFLTAMLYPKMMPCKNVSGVEEELMKLAKAQQKEIKGLETIQFQASVFDSIPYEDQAKELLKSIDSIDVYKNYFDTMVQVYKSQQLDQLEALFTRSEFGMEDHQDVLLFGRNRNWATQLKTIIPQKSTFVAVGAGHLVGDKGLIALLRGAGYTLKPIKND